MPRDRSPRPYRGGYWEVAYDILYKPTAAHPEGGYIRWDGHSASAWRYRPGPDIQEGIWLAHGQIVTTDGWQIIDDGQDARPWL